MTLRALLDGLPVPILQAPMVGASLDGLALAVNAAGGMGTLAAGALAPADIAAAIAAMKAASDRPFGVNLLMAPRVSPDAATVEAALERLAPWYAELGEAPPETPNQYAPDFEAQLAAVVAAAPAVASFTFGILTRDQAAALRAAGTYVVGTATSVAEARAWAEAGADGICAQGFEAGGHRGHFLAELDASLVGTMALVTTIRAAVDLPVIAAGGIMDGRGVAAVLALGASAAQMGTAFLLADEATTSKPWQRAVSEAGDEATRLTRAFTGRYARGVENRFMRLMHGVQGQVPAYPVQNRLTQPLRAAAAKADDPEMLSLWAGQAVGLARPGAAGEMVRRWWAEARKAAADLAARTGRPE
ncbi:nitronate monooxygenase [Phenylobacterium sp.]|uniref:NAD(P)H-dependent flavin oxidoreductase n=1 Tax=Phenylobacterium sp. TaxID=1871053 RepID=UPI0025E493C2|nr:nitronate monooxygenase [Phenylobacterium sp.]MBX3485441.1 nitronate monooxygenase [Phenylobacterium sp.]MCW5759533.1 nitronate monooxygenase [Phenylobacterium sp.]